MSAGLKWQAPSSDGGSPITNYVVEKRDVRRKAWQAVDTTVKELKYTVTPLNEGSLYVFRVAAENAAGMGEFCEMEDAVLAKDTFSEYRLLLGLSSLVSMVRVINCVRAEGFTHGNRWSVNKNISQTIYFYLRIKPYMLG